MSIDLRATYRLQLRPEFGFEQAGKIIPYLAELGISHVYCSPYLQAAPGSTHGYDVIDPGRVNKELGGFQGQAQFCKTLRQSKLGQILDIVPNHMAITAENPWWWDVLENGPSSRFASYFDVDWDHPERRLENVILVPILGNHYGRVLEAGDLRLVHQSGRFTIHYYEHVLPVAPRSLDTLLAEAARRCNSPRLAFLADALENLPLATTKDRQKIAQRHRDKQEVLELLHQLCDKQPKLTDTIDTVVAEINADADKLDGLLEQQNYRLAYWRMAERDLGYRRFFDINTLVGMRMEDEQVFADTHRLVLAWLSDGTLDGLRIDHPDGLRDPETYLQRLKQSAPNAYVVVEKILESTERLRSSWPVAGTSGYDFLNTVSALFVDPDGEKSLSDFYNEFTGEELEYETQVHAKKHLIMQEVLGSDVNRLTELLLNICERHRRYRDYSRHELREALREIIACFPVYRTYVRPEANGIHEDDIKYISEAILQARELHPNLDPHLFQFIEDLLLLKVPGDFETEFALRFQQFTGPAMAKGVEDTLFYCYNRLISLNEVGGRPDRFGISLEEFHGECSYLQQSWPQTMLTTSTHDTKRSGDVRARIHLLSEMPKSWAKAVKRWSKLNEHHRQNGQPDRNMEYFFYQTLVGAWPITTKRMLNYMEKATREAKVYTSWNNPNRDYDAALKHFVQNVLSNRDFITDFEAFLSPLIEPGRINSVAQTLIKLTAPGVPDIYQGTELWNHSLVDPDNRRQVDYELRRKILKELKNMPPDKIWQRIDAGLPKMWVIKQTLAARARHPQYFGAESNYTPLKATGSKAEHVIAFMRAEGAITVAPRLILSLKHDWKETAITLPPGRWRNVLTHDDYESGKIKLADLLKRFPVGLLISQETS